MSQFWKPGAERPRLLDDEEGGILFYSASPITSSGYGYASMEKQKQRLPVYQYRRAILYLVETHATTIVVGETGSGKTTQIPQYLKEAGWAEGGRIIACTQPRRLAVQLQHLVSYELTLNKKILNPVKSIAMYQKIWTMDRVHRRPFYQLRAEDLMWRSSILRILLQIIFKQLSIHDQEPPGDILVFLTGQDDIDAAVQLLSEETHTSRNKGLIVLLLYSGLSRVEQDLIFSPPPKGQSTNIAETSLTLEGIVYVVDSGFSKQKFYNPILDIENLVVSPISRASARQRAGRPGRIRRGKCYRLYTEEYFVKEMSADGIPEIQRSNLVSSVIQLKALGIDNILGFDWPASPPPEALIRALEVLYSLGAIDDDAKLTSPTGFQVAEIPLDPMISKMILASDSLGCSEEVITIAAILSIQSIWVSARGSEKELDEAKLRFAAAEGDHVTFLNVYNGFLQSSKSSKWCHKNFINYHSMKKALEVREQLRRIAQRLGIGLKSCEKDIQTVRKAVTAGFFANACHLEPYSYNGMYKTVRTSQEVYIHPSSVLFRVNPRWIVYNSLVSTDRQYMRNVISVEPSWLTEVAPHFYQHQQIP